MESFINSLRGLKFLQVQTIVMKSILNLFKLFNFHIIIIPISKNIWAVSYDV